MSWPIQHRFVSVFVSLAALTVVPVALVVLAAPLAAQSEHSHLKEAVEDILAPLIRGEERFALHFIGRSTEQIDITARRVEGTRQQNATIRIDFRAFSADAFELSGHGPWAEFVLRRTADRTILLLPKHQVAFVGQGRLESSENLAPAGFAKRLLGGKAGLLALGRDLLLGAIATANNVAKTSTGRPGEFDIGGRIRIRRLTGEDSAIVVSSAAKMVAGVKSLEIRRGEDPGRQPSNQPQWLPDTIKRRVVDRGELERMAFRALRRGLQTFVPQLHPATSRTPRKTAHGDLRFRQGQRLLLLHGTPKQLGHAQGELLGDVVRRTVDSTLYLVGMIETVRTGRWFPHVLDDAWEKLSPHIPSRHHEELDALADAIPELSRRELRLSNVFPEYFHCSGFALFGRATKDGKLYHGRVLDYMTMIGLQQAAVTTIVKPQRGYAFINVGYAGFIGSVTGMNEQQISLGEMGGRGRFQWNGVPMATLMRRGLEECGTLAAVKKLWTDSPRTCEYFYVFADGKHRRAVGVAATPDKLEFLVPGQTHQLLGTGIEDAIVLSAGSRLKRLRRRVEKHYGKIDVDRAIRLMDRPVAMSSNLHNALMVPEDGTVYIAHAAKDQPAAKMPYVRYDLRKLLAELPAERQFEVQDTIEKLRDDRVDATAMLRSFSYEAQRFEATLRPHRQGDGANWHTLVTFPSPKPPEENPHDRVVLEWYHANPRRTRGVAKAVLVMHILDGRMRVARGIAQVLANKGLHAFVMHMPGYGRRAGRKGRRHGVAKRFLTRAQQAVSDTRRARDVIAAIPGIDPEAISIQGTSLGGFIAALAAAVDHSFEHAFLMLAGGDLVDMFENGQKDTAKVRTALAQAGFSPAQLSDLLRAIDPQRLAHRLRPHRTWLYSARDDTVVPAKNARALGEAARLDDEHHLWYNGNHYTCALHLPAILEHMVQRLR